MSANQQLVLMRTKDHDKFYCDIYLKIRGEAPFYRWDFMYRLMDAKHEADRDNLLQEILQRPTNSTMAAHTLDTNDLAIATYAMTHLFQSGPVVPWARASDLLKRDSKHDSKFCNHRWLNHLMPALVFDPMSEQEERLARFLLAVCKQLHMKHPYAATAHMLHRASNEIKNFFYSIATKKYFKQPNPTASPGYTLQHHYPPDGVASLCRELKVKFTLEVEGIARLICGKVEFVNQCLAAEKTNLPEPERTQLLTTVIDSKKATAKHRGAKAADTSLLNSKIIHPGAIQTSHPSTIGGRLAYPPVSPSPSADPFDCSEARLADLDAVPNFDRKTSIGIDINPAFPVLDMSGVFLNAEDLYNLKSPSALNTELTMAIPFSLEADNKGTEEGIMWTQTEMMRPTDQLQLETKQNLEINLLFNFPLDTNPLTKIGDGFSSAILPPLPLADLHYTSPPRARHESPMAVHSQHQLPELPTDFSDSDSDSILDNTADSLDTGRRKRRRDSYYNDDNILEAQSLTTQSVELEWLYNIPKNREVLDIEPCFQLDEQPQSQPFTLSLLQEWLSL